MTLFKNDIQKITETVEKVRSHKQAISIAKGKARNFNKSYTSDVVKMARRTNGNAI